jgi:hypothetical protein
MLPDLHKLSRAALSVSDWLIFDSLPGLPWWHITTQPLIIDPRYTMRVMAVSWATAVTELGNIWFASTCKGLTKYYIQQSKSVY